MAFTYKERVYAWVSWEIPLSQHIFMSLGLTNFIRHGFLFIAVCALINSHNFQLERIRQSTSLILIVKRRLLLAQSNSLFGIFTTMYVNHVRFGSLCVGYAHTSSYMWLSVFYPSNYICACDVLVFVGNNFEYINGWFWKT